MGFLRFIQGESKACGMSIYVCYMTGENPVS